MSASIERLAHKNVAIVRYTQPFNPVQDLTHVKTELEKFLASSSGVFNVIVDLSQINLTFADLVESMSQTVDPASETSAKKGRLVNILVGSDALIKMAADAYAQEQYGKTKVDIYPSVEVALEHIQA
ncbi:MAG TPA: hypothetical protein VHP83_03795 [Aggregatilineaceae bacterium]|nr:hypothetical protein [Aggregatilineaceae bacterium]